MNVMLNTSASGRKRAGLPATAIQSNALQGIVVVFRLRVFSSSFASFSSSLYPAIKEKKKMKLTKKLTPHPTPLPQGAREKSFIHQNI